MIIGIILIFVFFLFFINVFFVIILKKNSDANLTIKEHLFFSVVIAAKNEEKNIPRIINSLKKLDYPKDKFEIIIIDDNSSDKTYELVSELIKGKDNFYLYKAEQKEFPAKKGSLNFGIKKAKNPFIIITDADCLPEKDWLKSYSENFNKGFEFVFGNSPFLQNHSLVNKISCFENLRSSILSFTAARIGFPYSASARNFGFKKLSFEKIEGYSNTMETLSGDDDLLLREAVKYKLKIGAVLNNDSFVYSSAKKKFMEYFNQRARHTKTSFYYLPGRQIILAAWHLTNLFLLFSPILILLNKLFFLLFILKLFADLLAVKSLQNKFGYKFTSLEIIYLQVFYEVFLVVHFINALCKKDKWK